MESMSDKLRSLGVRVGVSNNSPHQEQKKATNHPKIKDLVNGEIISNLFGESLTCGKDYQFPYFHGKADLAKHVSLDVLCQVSGNTSVKNLEMGEILFLDTETSGLGGGTGTFAFMIGLGYFERSAFRVEQLFIHNPAEEASMLTELIRIVSGFKAVLTYNGKTFDIPLLNNRYILNGLSTPFSDLIHIDLLQITRKIWSNRFSSRSLGNLENQLLGFFRSGEEVPGWLVPQLYFDYLLNQDPRPLLGVFYHNQIDILSLAGLTALACQVINNPNANEIHNLDRLGVAKVYQSLGLKGQALDIYDNCLQKDLPKEHQLQAAMTAAAIYKRDKNWDNAIALWEEAAGLMSLDACIELAKYFEHTSKDIEMAISWTRKAIVILEEDKSYFYKQIRMEEYQKRLNRLIKKSKVD